MAQDKAQLVAYFEQLDLATLIKLQKYSEQIIIPDEDMLLNVTMSQMIDKAHSLADVHFPEWTDRSKSDFGEFLVELFALFSEKDFWYLNAFANEGILRKMRSFSNAFVKAATLGYQAATLKGSSASFEVTFPPGEEVVYNRGDLVVQVEGIKFTNDAMFMVPQQVTAYSITQNLSQGEINQEDYTFNGHSVYIRRSGIDISSVGVVVDNIAYAQVKTFGNSSEGSTHFIVLPEEDGSASVFFGDGTLGLRPDVGRIIQVYYRKCGGSSGNVALSATTTLLDGLSDRYPTEAVMLTKATGGQDQETLSSIKEKAPLYFKAKKALINPTLAEEALEGFSFVRRARVLVDNRYIIYRAIPTSGDADLSSEEMAILQTDFTPYLMSGFLATYQTNTYRDVIAMSNLEATGMILDVLVYKGYNTASLASSIRQILTDVTNPLISADYGGSFLKSDVDIQIRKSLTGIQGVTFKLLVNGSEQIMADVQLDDYEIFSPIDQGSVTIRFNVV